jgi:diguanylate cyclase (GGDEF)-like protein
VLLPETEADKASGLAERLRQEVAGLAVPAADGSPVSRTASLGLAGLCPGVASYSALYRAADQALYRAKQNGRNRVEGAVCV